MILNILAYILVFLFLLPDECAKERVHVRVLSDISARSMTYRASKSSIKKLILIRPDSPVKSNTLRQRPERKTYSITCKISNYEYLRDGSFRLTLQDLKDTTISMIADIPNPDCDVMADCTKLEEIRSVFNNFMGQYRIPDTELVEAGTYKIQGVLFFNPNKETQISPIIGIKKIS